MNNSDNNEKNTSNNSQSKSKNKNKKFNRFYHKKKNNKQKFNSPLNDSENTDQSAEVQVNEARQDVQSVTEEKTGPVQQNANQENRQRNKSFSQKRTEQQKAQIDKKGKEQANSDNKKAEKKSEIEYIEVDSSFEEQRESKLNEFRNNGLTGETVEIVGVKFKQGGKLYYFSPGSVKFNENDYVIVETVRGLEMGFIAVPNKEIDTGKIVSQLKSVVRAATKADMETHKQNKLTEERAKGIFVQKAAERGLEMTLMDVELTFDNTKLIFYFIAEGRVDFRELVKDLASIFHTRIELRQIGVRDEAKQLGGLGICGQPFCCKRFLSDFPQVSIKMAKEQNLSLSSSKISGTCGRLMCCLSYEEKVYEMEYATFPRVDSVVITPAGKGVITESNFLNGIIKVRMNSEGLPVIKTFTAKDIKVIGHIKPNDDVPDDVKKLED